MPAAVVAVVEVWQAMRRPGESPGRTFRRLGLDTVGQAVVDRVRDRRGADARLEPVGDDLAAVAS